MHAAAARFEIRLPLVHSLKEKRGVIKHLAAAITRSFPVSVAEVDHQDTWQRSALGVAVVSSHPNQVDRILDSVEQLIDGRDEIELLSVAVSHLEAAE